jgi:hypothetical protein
MTDLWCRVLIGLQLAAAVSAGAQPTRLADSIVLERTLCYGTCPAYRLSITADGRVAFESRNPGDSARTASDSSQSRAFQYLRERAAGIGFETLPDTIANSRSLCSDSATDHPTATVTIHFGSGRKAVVDYRGCFARSDHSVVPVIAGLRAFEAAIDSAVNSARWVRPARRRAPVR